MTRHTRFLVTAASLLAAAACNSTEATAPTADVTGIAALTSAKANNRDLIATLTGSVSQTFPTGELVSFRMGGSATRTVGGTSSGLLVVSGTVTPASGVAMPFAEMLDVTCVAMKQVGTAVHVYVEGKVSPTDFGYAYLIDDPAGDKGWSGPLAASSSSCAVPERINTAFTPAPMPWAALMQPLVDGSVTVRIAR